MRFSCTPKLCSSGGSHAIAPVRGSGGIERPDKWNEKKQGETFAQTAQQRQPAGDQHLPRSHLFEQRSPKADDLTQRVDDGGARACFVHL